MSHTRNHPIKHPTGAGLGFRRELLPQMHIDNLSAIDFFEVSPENWINSQGVIGGHFDKILRAYTERFDFICHGLSLSIGSTKELDVAHVKNIQKFMKSHDISLFTEHLSWCSDQKGHLYDLLPIPCTEEAVFWVADRIKQVQDIMGQRIGLENASYYYNPPNSEMSDSEFIHAVVTEADCLLHLDVNNVFVNSQNFGFDPHQYLRELPIERTCYLHIAGHYVDTDGLIIDTHGDSVIEKVWALLSDAYDEIYKRTQKTADKIPTCLERDFNFPELGELIDEVNFIRELQTAHAQKISSNKTA
ncbi:HvfB family MNIO-type RiPP peptide maturase [Moraxella marmotae]|uniref:HvfB family MNIO-type RiPP peptide maturase n=1 Tax=Moraxella marmotae TaxID=3344520 RepID=UPI0035F2EAC5